MVLERALKPFLKNTLKSNQPSTKCWNLFSCAHVLSDFQLYGVASMRFSAIWNVHECHQWYFIRMFFGISQEVWKSLLLCVCEKDFFSNVCIGTPCNQGICFAEDRPGDSRYLWMTWLFAEARPANKLWRGRAFSLCGLHFVFLGIVFFFILGNC